MLEGSVEVVKYTLPVHAVITRIYDVRCPNGKEALGEHSRVKEILTMCFFKHYQMSV